MKHRGLLLPIAGLAAVMIGACSDDEGGPAPTLQDIWPHADGSAWTFEVSRSWAWSEGVEMYASLPSLETLHADLRRPPPGAAASSDTYLYTFALDGMTVTSAGMPVQAVVNTAEPVGAEPTAPFDQVGSNGSTLLGGTAFAFQDSGFYRYSTTSDHRHWIYLEGDLRPGTEFSLRQGGLFPFDWHLTGRVWSVGNRMIGGKRYAQVVECMYRLDLGEAAYDGGTVRNIIYGVMDFAPGAGPVAWHERSRVISGTAYGPQLPGCLDQHGVLVDAALPQEH